MENTHEDIKILYDYLINTRKHLINLIKTNTSDKLENQITYINTFIISIELWYMSIGDQLEYSYFIEFTNIKQKLNKIERDMIGWKIWEMEPNQIPNYTKSLDNVRKDLSLYSYCGAVCLDHALSETADLFNSLPKGINHNDIIMSINKNNSIIIPDLLISLIIYSQKQKDI